MSKKEGVKWGCLACVPYDRSGWCLAGRGGYAGRFVLRFLLPCRWCALRRPGGGSAGEGRKGLKFYLAYFFPVKPQVCNPGANCSNPNFILCKIVFVFLVNVNTVNSISRPIVNIIVLCKGPSGLVTKI